MHWLTELQSYSFSSNSKVKLDVRELMVTCKTLGCGYNNREVKLASTFSIYQGWAYFISIFGGDSRYNKFVFRNSFCIQCFTLFGCVNTLWYNNNYIIIIINWVKEVAMPFKLTFGCLDTLERMGCTFYHEKKSSPQT